MRGSARFSSSDGSGELIVELRGSDGGSQPNYKVVDTDYTSYAIVYNCFEKLFIGKKGREEVKFILKYIRLNVQKETKVF